MTKDIDVASLNITAGGKVTNTANINVTGTLRLLLQQTMTPPEPMIEQVFMYPIEEILRRLL